MDVLIASHVQSGSLICVAHDGERLQPVYVLISTSLRDSLNEFLESGDHKIERWNAMHDYVEADFSACEVIFHHINAPEDQQSL